MGIFTVKPEKITYTDTSKIPPDYTEKMDKEYDRMAKGYDLFMTLFPLWKKWIKKVIPHIQGDKILEVSFGTGYLLTKYAAPEFEIHGIDYNRKMLEITRNKMNRLHSKAWLVRGNVENLPYPDHTFDTIINTMAFTGYPDGDRAMSEFYRVLKPHGKLLLVDFDYPENRNVLGYWIVRLFEKFGDVIKEIPLYLENHGFDFERYPAGAFGSAQLFIAKKKE